MVLVSDDGVCRVISQLNKAKPDYEEIWEGERNARTGCVDTKRLLADRIIASYATARDRYEDLMAHPDQVDEILAAGAERIRPIAEATMTEVHEKMGLR